VGLALSFVKAMRRGSQSWPVRHFASKKLALPRTASSSGYEPGKAGLRLMRAAPRARRVAPGGTRVGVWYSSRPRTSGRLGARFAHSEGGAALVERLHRRQHAAARASLSERPPAADGAEGSGDFGDVALGTPRTLPFTLLNQGGAASGRLTVTSASNLFTLTDRARAHRDWCAALCVAGCRTPAIAIGIQIAAPCSSMRPPARPHALFRSDDGGVVAACHSKP